MALPQAFLAHQVPGRTRVRVPEMRNDVDYFTKCERSLANHPDVSDVRINPRTGSILIHREGNGSDLRSIARELDLFELNDAPFGPPLSHLLQDRLYGFADDFKRATGGQLDVSGVSIVVLTALACYQIARERTLPAGWTLLWNASSLLQQAGAEPSPAPQVAHGWTTH